MLSKQQAQRLKALGGEFVSVTGDSVRVALSDLSQSTNPHKAEVSQMVDIPIPLLPYVVAITLRVG